MKLEQEAQFRRYFKPKWTESPCSKRKISGPGPISTASDSLDNYLLHDSAQALPLCLVTYHYPPVLREALPDLVQGEGRD